MVKLEIRKKKEKEKKEKKEAARAVLHSFGARRPIGH